MFNNQELHVIIFYLQHYTDYNNFYCNNNYNDIRFLFWSKKDSSRDINMAK